MTKFDGINFLTRKAQTRELNSQTRTTKTGTEGSSTPVKNDNNDRGVFVQRQERSTQSGSRAPNQDYRQQDLNNIFKQGVQNYTPANSALSQKSYSKINNLHSTADVNAAMHQLKADMRGCTDAAKLQQFMDIQADLNMRMEVLEQKEASQAGLTAPTHNLNAKDNRDKDVSVSSGNAQAAEAQKSSDDLKKQTSEVNTQGKEANSIAKDANKTTKALTKDIKTLDKQYKSEVKSFEKNSQTVSKLSQKMQESQQELNALQSEADAILDKTGSGQNSAYSLHLAGDTENEDNSVKEENNKKLNDINQKMSSITSKQQGYTTRMQSASSKMRTSNTNMTNTVKMKQQYYTQTAKSLEKQEQANNKIEKFAQNVEDIATTVKNVGSITEKTGKIMVATGTALCSNPFTAAAGAALIKAGGVVTKVGIVTEKVGTAGVAAAQVTKTASALVEGNLTKALARAGSAVQTAAAAFKGAQGMGEQLKAVDDQVADGIQIAADTKAQSEAIKVKIEQAADGAVDKSTGGLKGLFQKGQDIVTAGKDFYDDNKESIDSVISNGKGVINGINGLKRHTTTGYTSNPNQQSNGQIRAGLNNGSIVSDAQWAELQRRKDKMGL